MLTIKVNGQVTKLSIGCRTFITLDVLLTMLGSKDQNVILNGKPVDNQNYGSINVCNGDTLKLDGGNTKIKGVTK
jgi:sulfur carrier protein ThiS